MNADVIYGRTETSLAHKRIAYAHNSPLPLAGEGVLGEIPEVGRDDICSTQEFNAAPGVLITGIVRSLQREGGGDTLLSVMDVDRLLTRLGYREEGSGASGSTSLVPLA